MGFKRVTKKGGGAYDLSRISWRCTKCDGRPTSSYAMSGYEKYCYCDKK